MIGARLLLGLLSGIALLGCDLPRPVSVPLALLAAGWGLLLARAESRRRRCELVWPSAGVPLLDGVALQGATLHWRGPLAFLCWNDRVAGRCQLDWWPDTLPPAGRRELRLAAHGARTAQPRASMAP